MRFPAFRPSPRVTLAAALVAAVGATVALVTPFSFTAGAADAPTPVTDLRVAYIGTDQRSIGTVDGLGAEATSPAYFSGNVQHYDEEASSRGDVVTWVSRRDSRWAQVFVQVGGGEIRRLADDPVKVAGHPVVSPDGTQVAFDWTSGAKGTPRTIWVVGVDGSNLHQVSDSTGDNWWPTWSPDGSEIAFAGRRDTSTGQQQIYCLSLATGEILSITTAATAPDGAGEPDWNPVADRNLIAYTANPDSSTGQKVHVATPSGTDDRAILVDSWESKQPAWSPDGVTIAFLSRTRASDNSMGTIDQLYSGVPNDNGCPCFAILRFSQDRLISNPAWYTPSGGVPQLMITRSSGTDQYTGELQDVRPDGSDPRDLGVSVLQEDPGANDNANLVMHPQNGDPWTAKPSYSPDGRRILVSRFETSGNFRVARLWVVNADGTNPVPLTVANRAVDSQETDATWSPDGTKIAYSRRTSDDAGQIVVINATTGEQLADVPRDGNVPDTQPAWSPDSTKIAFTRGYVDGDSLTGRIWIANADGSGADDFSGATCGCGIADYGSSFSPDGKQISFGRSPDGLVTMNVDKTGCTVLMPPNAKCGDSLAADPDGHHHPQDTDWSPDGKLLTFTARREAPDNSPEYVKSYRFPTASSPEFADGLTFEEVGRQKRPVWQHSSDITTTLSDEPDSVDEGETTTLTIAVTDNGPSPAYGIKVPLQVPAGLQVTDLQTEAGSCRLDTVTCDLGSIGVGTTSHITVTVKGVTAGEQTLTWTANGYLADANPTDNTGSAMVEVTAVSVPPSSEPPSSTPPSSTPPSPDPADLRLTVKINPTPTFVGRRTTVTYTLRNVGGETAPGVTFTPKLPGGIPVTGKPKGCTTTNCDAGDVDPGDVLTFVFVLTPGKAVNTPVKGTVTPEEGTPVTATTTLKVLQPKIVATPEIGPPGFVTIVRGTDFPPGIKVSLSWDVGLTAQANPSVVASDGTFTAQLLVLPKDALGPRKIQATGSGFTKVTTDFRVILPNQQAPGLVLRK